MPTTLKEFESVFPQLVEDVSEHCRKYRLPDNILQWFQHVCAYTIPKQYSRLRQR